MQQQPIDLTGQRFGRLLVLHRWGHRRGRRAWQCRCDCGNLKVVTTRGLRENRTKSCGCLARKHGWAVRGKGKKIGPEYVAWMNMTQRCHRPTHKVFRYYGGRGITVCAEWRDDFMAFFQHIGPRPGPGYSIDRIDNEAGYFPGNVRWATRSEQARNQRPRRARRRLADIYCAGQAALLGEAVAA